MSPEECISALDGALASAGEGATLRRVVGQGGSAINIDVAVRALVRAFRPQELVGGILQSDSNVTLSPSDINAAQWPGGQSPLAAPFNPPAWLPRANDKLIIQGRLRNVTFVKPIEMDGVIVRIDLTVAG